MQTVQFSHCFAVESSLGDYSFVWSFPLTVRWLCAFGRVLCFRPSSLSTSMVTVRWLCAFGRVLCFTPSSLSTSMATVRWLCAFGRVLCFRPSSLSTSMVTVRWLCAFGRVLCFTPSSLSTSMATVRWLCAFGRVLCFRPSSLSTSMVTVRWLCAFGRVLCFTPSSLSTSMATVSSSLSASMVTVSWLCAFGRVLCFRPSSLSASMVQHLHPRQWNPAGCCVAFCVSWCCLELESKLWTIAFNNSVIRNWTTCFLEAGQCDFLVVRVQEHFVVHYRDEDAAWRQETDAWPGWKLAVSIPCGHAVLPWQYSSVNWHVFAGFISWILWLVEKSYLYFILSSPGCYHVPSIYTQVLVCLCASCCCCWQCIFILFFFFKPLPMLCVSNIVPLAHTVSMAETCVVQKVREAARKLCCRSE